MFTGTTGHVGALVTTVAVLTGAAILRGGAAAADPNQDDQFLALLDQKGIPALSGVPSLIDTAHKVCGKLDAGMSADGLVDLLVKDAYGIDPPERQYAPGRLARTQARFITAAVEAYCPQNQGKTASLVGDPTPGSDVSTHRRADTHSAVNVGSDLQDPAAALDVINVPSAWQQPPVHRAMRLPHAIGDGIAAHRLVLASLTAAVPTGDLSQPDPPQIPAPAPPTAHVQTPHPPMAAPHRPQQPAPPPPQRPPPPVPQQPPPAAPQQPPPPAVGPQPGGAAGSGGDGSTGGNDGGGPAEQPPPLDTSPGFVRLAP